MAIWVVAKRLMWRRSSLEGFFLAFKKANILPTTQKNGKSHLSFYSFFLVFSCWNLSWLCTQELGSIHKFIHRKTIQNRIQNFPVNEQTSNSSKKNLSPFVNEKWLYFSKETHYNEFAFAELLQGLVEHVRLHHGGGEHHRRHQDGLRRLPQTLSSRQTHQTSEEKCQCSDSPLHFCSIIQGPKWSIINVLKRHLVSIL